MLSLIAMLLGIAILSSSVDSQCPMKCSVNILNKYPGNGYRASVTVVSPVWVRRRRRVVIRMKFDKLVKKVEHVHIVGGNLRRKGSNITRNEVRLLSRPQATIRKAKSVSFLSFPSLEIRPYKPFINARLPLLFAMLPKERTNGDRDTLIRHQVQLYAEKCVTHWAFT